MDISAAFAKVWHKGLLSNLCQIGISGKFIVFFTSCLINKQQCVVIEGLSSTLADIKAGVLQGSRLGPLFFIIFINDIVENLEREIFLFADDTTILASDKDPTETLEILNRYLKKNFNLGK